MMLHQECNLSISLDVTASIAASMRLLWCTLQVLKLFVWHPEQLPAMLRTVAQQGSLLRSLTAQAPKALQALQAQSGAAGLPPSFLRHIICAVTCLAVHLAASQVTVLA